MVRPTDKEWIELRKKFVLYRVQRMNDVDLSIFQFDYDNTWMSFFLDANDHVYSRYGMRDEKDPEGRLSIEGFKKTARRVLAAHADRPADPPPREHKPVYPRDLFEVKGGGCLHCHQVWEGMRRQLRRDKKDLPESLIYVYPLPENIGLELSVDEGNLVLAVRARSPAAQGGIRKGDRLESIGDVPILAQGDVMFALHNAPAAGKLSIQFRRDGLTQQADLELPPGWRKNDVSWRRSLQKEKLVK